MIRDGWLDVLDAADDELRVRFEQEIVPALMRDLKITNRMRVPTLGKIVINMSLSFPWAWINSRCTSTFVGSAEAAASRIASDFL